jgi:hypothetical protein
MSRWTSPRESLGSRGFQQWSRGSHEQKLMIFPAVEYDAGESLHLNNTPYSAHQSAFKKGRGAIPLILPSILKFKCN